MLRKLLAAGFVDALVVSVFAEAEDERRHGGVLQVPVYRERLLCWVCSGLELLDEFVELFAAAVAEQEDLDAKGAVRAEAADDALYTEAEAVYLEAEIEAVADDVIGRLTGLDETAVEAEVEDLAGEGVPVLEDAKLDGAVAGVASRLAAFYPFVHQRDLVT